ncbi:MAG: DNA polymerase III subunit alpha [Erysipelotrichaceae bacterium]|nr:DNA polymerase III subunit alpha [Erysipelotrichaceae bacterium]
MFGHLQVYSSYSFQNSTILIKDLIQDALKKHIDVLALTDKDNMYGTLEFSKECLKYGIKPIFGLDASVHIEDDIYSFILLAIDDQGYFELMKICSHINLSSDKSISLDDLSKYQHILVISSSHDIIASLVSKNREDDALHYIKLFQSLFHDNYYIMIQNHHLSYQKQLNTRLISLANYMKVKVICSNEVRYLRSQDAFAIDLMQAAKQGTTLDINYSVQTNEKYLKTKEEMNVLFDKQIIKDTQYVLNLCKATIPLQQNHLPIFPLEKGTAYGYLTSLCKVGIKKRFKGKSIPQKYIDRLKYELKIIHEMGFDDYFLIVWDYVRYAKVNHIQVGPGRGSACGSLVAYCLGITNIDPIAYDLFFERFLNPERVSMPDIDIDFQDNRRDEVIQYVIGKYGVTHAAQIVTFNTYGPRIAIRDMGKVMGVPLATLNIITKMVPTGPKNKKSISEVYQTSAQFQLNINRNPALKKIIGACSIIEYLPRNISMHAAGVIISKEPLNDVVPLVYGPNNNLMSQYSKDYIEEAGLLKMDFLGLKNLTMIDYILKDIKANTHQNINLNEIPLDDSKTYELIASARTFGVFQLESEGMRSLLKRMKPTCFEDIVTANALYRPGPMKNIPLYLEGRNHPDKVTYPLKELEPILKSTYGVMVYQEQMMQVAQKMAGFSLGKADILRKATSKKESDLMASMKKDFIDGCLSNGYTKDKAIEVFQLIEKFADYGFNKSHSVAYGYIAYELAYLKANYPLYFFASILSNEGSSQTSKLHCIQECKDAHVDILPPSVNHSYDRFMVENGHIRYSLLAIKNVGYGAYKDIEKEREKGLFKDIYDFMLRMDKSHVSKKVVEALIDAGAMDEFRMKRKMMRMNLDTIEEYAHIMQNLGIDEKPILKVYKDDDNEKLEREKAVLGLYLSKHPIELIKQQISIPIVSINHLSSYIGKYVNVVINVTRVKNIVDKKGNEMCFIEGNDETGSVDGVVFASRYKSLGMMLKRGSICLVNGRVDNRNKLSLIIEKVEVKETWKN